MSNEELVAMIQAGETDRMGELWEQVRRFVIKQARRVPLEGRADVELDDLIQSGYLALADSVADYTPGEYCFLTHLSYRLKTTFAEATRFRTERQQRETLAGILSLDTPLSDEVSSSTMMDLIPDPAGAEAFEHAEDQIYREQLRDAVAAVLAELPAEQQRLLRLRFWECATSQEIACAFKTTTKKIQNQETRTIRELRKPRNAYRLIHFYDFDYYSGTGIDSFRHTGQSIQERYLIREERRNELNRQRAEKEAARHRQQEARKQQETSDSIARANKLIDEYLSHLSPEERTDFAEKLARIQNA